MPSRAAGLTRAELTVALAIVAALASVAVPSALSNRIAANEASAVASLREIAAAQEKFKAAVYCDVNKDGVGEYGLLRELTGVVGVRTTSTAQTVGNVLDTPLVSRAFANFNADSEAVRSGYLFKIFLPGSVGTGVQETSPGALFGAIDNELAATTWCCYAWPDSYQRTGRRTFFVNQTGEFVAVDDSNYSGAGGFASSNAGAAFRLDAFGENQVIGVVAVGTRGRNNDIWRPVTDDGRHVQRVLRGLLASKSKPETRLGSFEFRLVPNSDPTEELIFARVRGVAPARSPRIVLTDRTEFRTADFVAFEYPLLDLDRHRFVHLPRGAFGFSNSWWTDAVGVSPLAEFSGGRIEIFVDGVAVADGRIPEFATFTGPNSRDATTNFSARTDLTAPNIRAPECGTVATEWTNDRRGTRQRVAIDVHALAADDFPCIAVSIVGGSEQRLGEIRRRGRNGDGELVLDSRRRKQIPAGGIAQLAGAGIKVYSASGVVLLAGTLPTIE